MIDDSFYAYRQGTTDSELLFFMLFSEGLETDPMGALERCVGKINAVNREAGIVQPFRLAAVLSDGHRIYAIRYAADEAPPSLYWAHHEDHLLVVSEPLDEEDGRQWNEVPRNQLLVT